MGNGAPSNQNPVYKELYEVEFLLRSIIDSSHDGIYVNDKHGKTIWYNKSFLRMSGFTPTQLDNNTVFDLLEQGALPNSAVAECIRTKKPITTIIKYPNGVEALVTGTPVMDDNNQLFRVIANIRDITQLNRLKKELENSAALTKAYKNTLKHVQTTEVEGIKVIYRSKTMEDIMTYIERASTMDAPVLILGESGVGKDVLAKYIHFLSDRNNKGSFMKINCGAIPDQLLESELFGYEPGAFSGADRKGKVGLLEIAHKGTVFLDEIGEMPLSLQVKLLGVLQDMEIQRVGGTKSIPIDIRVVAATNADLETMIANKQFRQDLFYRINVLQINVPPLRERKEDILPLVMHFSQFFNQKHHKQVTFSSTATDRLLTYHWPGNIRELKNMVERLVVFSDGEIIEESLLPVTTVDSLQNRIHPSSNRLLVENNIPPTLKEILENYEKEILADSLMRYHPLKKCAEKLDIDISTLVRKKNKYNL